MGARGSAPPSAASTRRLISLKLFSSLMKDKLEP